MSGSTTTNDFSIGHDTRIVLIMGVLGQLEFQHVTGFTATQIVKKLRVPILGSPPVGRDLPGGWNGSFAIERADPTADVMAATLELMFWNGQRLPTGQMYQYINEIDGSQSTFLFSNVTLNLASSGNWQEEDTVKQTVEFFASQRQKV